MLCKDTAVPPSGSHESSPAASNSSIMSKNKNWRSKNRSRNNASTTGSNALPTGGQTAPISRAAFNHKTQPVLPWNTTRAPLAFGSPSRRDMIPYVIGQQLLLETLHRIRHLLRRSALFAGQVSSHAAILQDLLPRSSTYFPIPVRVKILLGPY